MAEIAFRINGIRREIRARTILLAFLMIAATSSAQPPETFTLIGRGEGTDRGVGLLALADGGFLVTGISSTFGEGEESALLIRTDDSGAPLWLQTWGGSGDGAAWQAVESERGLAVVGFSEETATSFDCRLSLFSPDGALEWSRRYGGSGRERCWDAVATGDGGYALVGELVSDDETVHDCLLIRTDGEGEQLWSRTYDAGLQERCFAIEMIDDVYVLAGQTSADGGEDRDVFVVGADQNGEVLFEHVMGEEGIDLGHGIARTGQGAIIVGYSAGFGAEDVDPLLFEISGDGEILWTRTVDIAGDARGLTVDATPNGELCLAGFRRGGSGDAVPFVLRTDAEGRKLWLQELHSFDVGYTTVSDSDGRCVVTGHGGGVGDGGLDLFLARLGPGGEPSSDENVVDLKEIEAEMRTERLTLPRFSYPTWVSEDGRILYESAVTGNWEIWMMQQPGLGDGGGELVRLTDNDALDRMPSLSPDGRSIAFISDRDGDYEVFRMNSDGTGVMQLTFNDVPEIHPYWAPGGSSIIYNRRVSGERLYEIRMIDVDGSDDRTILRDDELNSYAQISPDGSMIVFDKWQDNDETNGEIYLLSLHDGSLTRLTDNDVYDGYPTWFPDGERILFASEVRDLFKLFSIRIDGSDLEQLTFGEGSDARPDVSPDGNRIVFNRDVDGNINIHVLTIDQQR